MPVNAYTVVLWIHVIAAAVVIGALAYLPLIRRMAVRSRDPEALRDVLQAIWWGTYLLVHPALAVLVVTGLFMSVGPHARWNMFLPSGRWILVGFILWVPLWALAGGFVGSVAKRMTRRLDGGKRDEARERSLLRQFQLAVIGALILALFIEALMTMKPLF